MIWMVLPLLRYAQFQGRSRPKEYWLYMLFLWLCLIALILLEVGAGLGVTTDWSNRGDAFYSYGIFHQLGGSFWLFWLGTRLPTWAVTVRRLHDSDHSGWWFFIPLLPVIGSIWLFVLLVMGGTRGPNRFGPDPIDNPPV